MVFWCNTPDPCKVILLFCPSLEVRTHINYKRSPQGDQNRRAISKECLLHDLKLRRWVKLVTQYIGLALSPTKNCMVSHESKNIRRTKECKMLQVVGPYCSLPHLLWMCWNNLSTKLGLLDLKTNKKTITLGFGGQQSCNSLYKF